MRRKRYKPTPFPILEEQKVLFKAEFAKAPFILDYLLEFFCTYISLNFLLFSLYEILYPSFIYNKIFFTIFYILAIIVGVGFIIYLFVWGFRFFLELKAIKHKRAVVNSTYLRLDRGTKSNSIRIERLTDIFSVQIKRNFSDLLCKTKTIVVYFKGGFKEKIKHVKNVDAFYNQLLQQADIKQNDK